MNYAFFYSDYRIIDKKSEFICNVYLPKFEASEIFKRGDFLATGTIYKRDIIQDIGFYNIYQKRNNNFKVNANEVHFDLPSHHFNEEANKYHV